MDVMATLKLPTGICAALMIGLAGCQGTRQVGEERVYRATHGRGDIVVGAGWPWQTRATLHYREGLDLAIDEVNASGGADGRRLRIMREDDRETVDEGRLVAQRFATNVDIVGVIGHLHSYVTNPAAAIYDTSGLVLISPASTDPELTSHGYKRVFRTIFTDRDVGDTMARFAIARGHRRVAIYYIRSAYGRGLANAFEETASQGGVMVVDRQSYDPNESGNVQVVGQVLADWKARNLDAIFIAGEAAQSALFIAEARAQGLSIPVLGGDAVGTPELFGRGATPVEGTIVASAFHPNEPRPEVRRFVAAFEDRYHTKPDAAAALAYDAVRLLARAISHAHSAAPDQVAAALHAADGWPGVTGTFTFTERGDPIGRTIVTMIANHGVFEYFASSSTRPSPASDTLAQRVPSSSRD